MNFKAAARSWSIAQSFVLAGCAAVDTPRSDLSLDASQVDAADVFERDGGDASVSDADSGRPRGPRADAGVGEEPSVEDIWAGPAMTCARVKRSGVVTTKCWGDNRVAQLGRGEASATPVETFVPQAILMADSSQVVAVRSAVDNSSQKARTCIILRDKTLKCWGSRWDSIDPMAGLVTAPPDAPLLTGVEDVRMGEGFLCARLETSNVACWGANQDGQLGLGTRDFSLHELPVTIPNFTADEIALSNSLACGRKGGDVWCWGGWGSSSSFGSTPTQVPNLHDVTQLRGGGDAVCALASDSTIWCWTADGAMSHLLEPTDSDPQRLLDNVAEFVMGAKASTLFLRMKDGTVRFRGAANNAEVVTSTVEGIVDPIRVVLGQTHQCAIMADGTVRCWGSNIFGQLAVDPKLLKHSALSVRVSL